LRPLAGWGAGETTLRTATFALVHSTAEYCAPAWCRSAHNSLIDPVINDALRTVTVCLRPTPVVNLPIYAPIQPPESRRKGATISLARLAMESGHLLNSAIARLQGGKIRPVVEAPLFQGPCSRCCARKFFLFLVKTYHPLI